MAYRQYHDELVREVAEELISSGYRVRLGVRQRLVGGYRADLLVEGRRVVAIEVKSSPVTLSDIRRAARLRGRRLIICVPDEVYNDTADSVLDYAAQAGIRLSSIGEIASVVSSM